MTTSMRTAAFALAAGFLAASTARAEDPLASLKKGNPDLQSAGALAFGPEGLLFVGDAKGAAIFAVDTGDRPAKAETTPLKVEAIDEKIANLLGTTPQQILVNDLAVNPASGKAYLSVSRGRGPDAAPVLVRVDHAGKVEAVPTENVPFAKAALPSPPDAGAAAPGGRPSPRSQAITDLAYVDGKVYIAGLSNEEFASRLLAVPFPFADVKSGTGIEIFHGAHGRLETRSPVRTFVPYRIAGDPYLLAAYTCTPLVKLAVADLKPGAKVKGTTVAELGNRNNPLDMIVYKKGGKEYLLLANSSRGVMKITTDGIDSAEPITKPVPDGNKAGQSYETISSLKGVEQLDSLGDQLALILVRNGGGLTLETVDLP